MALLAVRQYADLGPVELAEYRRATERGVEAEEARQRFYGMNAFHEVRQWYRAGGWR